MKSYILKRSFLKSSFFSALTAALISSGGLSGCASISEEKCQAGNWQELGYRDGSNGVKRGKASKIADTCAKYGIDMNFDAYLAGFNQGLPSYCTYERGFALGENGSSYNQICSGELAADFAPGYDEGRTVYEINKEHKSLISSYEDKLDDIAGTRGRLETEDLSNDDAARLRKKLKRFRRQAEDLKIDIRAWERLHDLPRYRS